MKIICFLSLSLLLSSLQAQHSMEPSIAVKEAWKQLDARRFNPKVVNEIYGRFQKPEDYLWFLDGRSPPSYSYYDVMDGKPEVVQIWDRILTWICKEKDETWSKHLPVRGGLSMGKTFYLPDPERERLEYEVVQADKINTLKNIHQQSIRGLIDIYIFPDIANRAIDPEKSGPAPRQKILERYGHIPGFRQLLLEVIAKLEENKASSIRRDDQRVWLTPAEWSEVNANRERIAKLRAAAEGKDALTLAEKKLAAYLKVNQPVPEVWKDKRTDKSSAAEKSVQSSKATSQLILDDKKLKIEQQTPIHAESSSDAAEKTSNPVERDSRSTLIFSILCGMASVSLFYAAYRSKEAGGDS